MQKKAVNSLFLVMLIVMTAIAVPLIGESNYLVSAAYAANSPASATMEGTWTATGDLNTSRSQYTATLLTNGKVLVAGGGSLAEVFTKSAELYDPTAETWTVTGSLNTGRAIHSATLLDSGKVLVVGGITDPGVLVYSKSAELYDPASGIWTVTGSLTTGRCGHTATLLPNGKVLVAGGVPECTAYPGGCSAEIYDPASGTWTTTGSRLSEARQYHIATLLPNGKVLVAGGQHGPSSLNSAEVYDPASGTWTVTGNLNTARQQFTATLLGSGKVLVAGGFNRGVGYANPAELYDPASGTWTTTGSLSEVRENHIATLLPNGKVLVAGGVNYISWFLKSAELYTPPPPTNGSVIINAEPADMNTSAPWTLTGPNSYNQTGAGDLTLNNLDAGNYTITWGDVLGWDKPSPPSETKVVTYGGTTTFSGTYVQQTIPPVCSGDVVVLQNMTFVSGQTYNCTATTSITAGTGVTVQSGAIVNFRAPRINLQPGFRVESGATFSAKQ